MSEMLTRQETAELMGISTATLHRMRARGAGPAPAIVPGRRSSVFYPRADVEAWVERARERREAEGGEYRKFIRSTDNNVRHRASLLGLAYDLSRALIAKMIRPVKRCPVLGIDLVIGGESRWDSPSLDRIVPERGYVQENVRVISNRANILRSNATPEESVLVAIDNLRVHGLAAAAQDLLAFWRRHFAAPAPVALAA